MYINDDNHGPRLAGSRGFGAAFGFKRRVILQRRHEGIEGQALLVTPVGKNYDFN